MDFHKHYRNGARVFVLAAALITAGCSTTGSNIDSAAELTAARTSSAETLVFGQLKLIRNGHVIQLGDGLRDNPATLHLFKQGDARELIRHVGADGEFAWVLPAGTYRVTNVGFKHHGETIEPLTNFSFTASRAHRANYVGVLTVEVSVDSGYLGAVATLDSHDVQADCTAACERKLTQLGLTTANVGISTLRWEGQIAGRN